MIAGYPGGGHIGAPSRRASSEDPIYRDTSAQFSGGSSTSWIARASSHTSRQFCSGMPRACHYDNDIARTTESHEFSRLPGSVRIYDRRPVLTSSTSELFHTRWRRRRSMWHGRRLATT